MKAEHRKELKTNTLVSTLEKVGHGLKEGPSRGTVVFLGIAGLLAVLVVVWNIASNMSASRNSKRWEQIYTADSPENLGEFAEKNRNTVQGRAARLDIARDRLADGLNEIYHNRAAAAEKLAAAAGEFEKLAGEFKSTPILVQECLFAAGRAREALGEFDEAIKRYNELASQFPQSTLAAEATELAKRVQAKKDEYARLQAKLKQDSQ